MHGWVDWLVPLSHSEEIFNEHGGPKKMKVVSAGPEQLALGAIFPLWMSDNMDKMARTGMPPKVPAIEAPGTTEQPGTGPMVEPAPAPQPEPKPAPKPAPKAPDAAKTPPAPSKP